MAMKKKTLGWPKAAAADTHAKRELELYADNTHKVHLQLKAAEEALARVVCRKKNFSVDLAARVFEPVLAAAAKSYSREHSSGADGLTMFSAATRRELAKDYAADFKQRVNGFLRHGQQDITGKTMVELTKCAAKPFAGAAIKRRRKSR